MRAKLFGLVAVCALPFVLLPQSRTIASPGTDNPSLMQEDTLADQDRWQGRHHYLYDEEYRPGAETVGSTPSDARACSNEPVRMRRSDGSTIVRLLRRCD